MAQRPERKASVACPLEHKVSVVQRREPKASAEHRPGVASNRRLISNPARISRALQASARRDLTPAHIVADSAAQAAASEAEGSVAAAASAAVDLAVVASTAVAAVAAFTAVEAGDNLRQQQEPTADLAALSAARSFFELFYFNLSKRSIAGFSAWR